MNATRPKTTVSAIIPTFNRRDYIRRAIDSILTQTVSVDEIIVVDDEHSSDNIAQAIHEWYGSTVRVITGQGGGLSGARYRGVHEAAGEWIAFLDSDDDWPAERTGQFLTAAARVPKDVAWIFGNTQLVTDTCTTTYYDEFGLVVNEDPQLFEDSLSVQFPFQFGVLSSSFIRRQTLVELDCFRTPLQHSEDVLAGFQVACRYRFAAIPQIVGSYFRTSDLSTNSAMIKGLSGPDYFRARMIAFSTVIRSGRKHPWIELYGSEVRGLCQALAQRGEQVPRGLSLQQFAFGKTSLKGVAFCVASMFGGRAIRAWNAIGELRRRRRGNAAFTSRFRTGLDSSPHSAL